LGPKLTCQIHYGIDQTRSARTSPSNLNAGKSSLLQALLFFINGAKLTKAEFYNPGKDIVITARLNCVTERILAKLTEEHRTKIAPFVKDESIVPARRYALDGTSKLRVIDLLLRLLMVTGFRRALPKGQRGHSAFLS